MRVNIKQLTKAVANITSLTNSDKIVLGIMLDIHEDYMNVCCADFTKAILSKVDIETSEGDVDGKIVVNYERMVSILNGCQSTGKIYTDYVDITPIGENVLNMRAEKKVATGEEDGEIQYTTFSIVEQPIAWQRPDSNQKVAVLNRVEYDNIFNVAEGNLADKWSISELRRVITKTSLEKGKTLYVYPRNSCAFVANINSLIEIPLDIELSNAIVLSTNVAKSLSDILGRIEGESVYVHVVQVVNRRYCAMYNENKTFGLWVELSATSRNHVTTLATYQQNEYKDYQITFIKDILKDVLASALTIDKAERTQLNFIKKEDQVELRLVSEGALSSAKNTYSVICTDCLTEDTELTDVRVSVSLKTLLDAVSKCDNEYVGLDLQYNEENNNVYVRIGDIDLEKRSEVENNKRKELNLGYDEFLSVTDELALRASTLGIKQYTLGTRDK